MIVDVGDPEAMNDKNPYVPAEVSSASVADTRRPTTHLFLMATAGPIAVLFLMHVITGTFSKFAWLFVQAAPWMLFAGPISIPACIWLCYAYKNAVRHDQLQSRWLLSMAPLVVIPIAMISWGTFFANPRGRGFIRWQLTVVHAAFVSTVAISALSIMLNSGRRSLVAAVAVLSIVFSFFCAFVAGQSVTGDWM